MDLEAVLADPTEGTEGKAGRVWHGPLTREEFLASIQRAVWVESGLMVEVLTPEGVAVWRFREGF